jgi:CRISPR system Cascade subunit CasB
MMADKQNNYFKPEHPVGKFLLEWCENLENNKGDRAQLRRCKTLSDVELSPAFQRAYWNMIKLFENPPSKEQCAVIIALAAHVKKNVSDPPGTKRDDQDRHFGHQMAQGSDGPKLHELRFRRLLRIEERDRLFQVLSKIIRHLERKVNLLDVMAIAFYWGDSARKQLAYQYYEEPKLD